MSKCIALVENVNIGMGQIGLIKLAKKLKLDPDKLPENTWIVFLNSKANKMKFLAPGGETILYYRTHNERRISKEAIAALPSLFGSSQSFAWSKTIDDAYTRLLVEGKHHPQLKLVA